MVSVNVHGEPRFLVTPPELIPMTYRSLELQNLSFSPPAEMRVLSVQSLENLGQPLHSFPLPLQSQVSVAVLSDSTIRQLFDEFRPQLPFLYVGDCCHDRAQMMSFAASKRSLPLAKVFVVGDLKLKHLGRYARSQDSKWTFHVAPVVQNENHQFVILDPATADQPILLKDWLDLFSEFSSREIYLATAGTYSPYDIASAPTEFLAGDNETAELSLMGCAAVQNNRLKHDTP